MTRYQLLVSKWKDCTQCDLHTTRNRVVQFRGSIPCDVAFIGEAPGTSEDTLGEPFVGPSGILLDAMVAEGIPSNLRKGFMNLLGCIPVDKDGKKATKPPEESIHQCKPRLEALLEMCKPKLVVCVGDDAAKYTQEGKLFNIVLPSTTVLRVHITHPANILRTDYVGKGLKIQRNVVIMQNAVHEVFTSTKESI